MKATELRSKSVAELKTTLGSLQKAHFSLRLQSALKQVSKFSEFKRIRREIARTKTILNENRLKKQ